LSEAYAESANYLAREAALIGDRAAHTRTVAAVEGTARGKLAFRNFASLSAALRGLDQQKLYGRPCALRRGRERRCRSSSCPDTSPASDWHPSPEKQAPASDAAHWRVGGRRQRSHGIAD
jgi:hypothetical protein